MLALAVIAATALTIAIVAGCGSDDEQQCVLGTAQGCEEGLICEMVTDGAPTCFAPVVITGRVFDAVDDSGIAEATVVALDANGSARSSVAVSGIDGTYQLPVPLTRDAQGAFTAEKVTLRVSAAGYQAFPSAPRTALPIDLGDAKQEATAWEVKNAATDVALFALSGDTSGLRTISGHVSGDAALVGGVLIVAGAGEKAIATAVSDAFGAFTIFNVPSGSVELRGYRQDVAVTPKTVEVANTPLENVTLDASAQGVATVSGSIQFANAPGGASTSVLLVVESTFSDATKRGETPAGLRAGDVTGAFAIEGVSPGRYVVLAAFENDGLVRDPDTTIGGTQIVRIEVSGEAVTLSESFKITGALSVSSPGATDVEPVSGDPTFVWEDDSSEDGYELRVYNALGTLVHEKLDIDSVSGSATVSYTWSGAQLQAGMIYQFHVLSYHLADKKDPQSAHEYISGTEDLRGVFIYEPQG